MTPAELRTAELKQELALHEQNLELYTRTQDARRELCEARIVEINRQLALLAPPAPSPAAS